MKLRLQRILSILGVILMIWAIVQACLGNTVAGWTSTVCIICLLGGIQLISLGVLGQYIGKTYLETKRRPRYIISARTWEPETRHWIEENDTGNESTEKEQIGNI